MERDTQRHTASGQGHCDLRDVSVGTKLAFEGLSHFIRGREARLPSTGCSSACGFRARSPGSQVPAEPCLQLNPHICSMLRDL